MQIRQQNTGRESNPAHFSVIRISWMPSSPSFEHGFPQRNPDWKGSLSSFGTFGRQTDAENPQVN
jgi:hypothetical protein